LLGRNEALGLLGERQARQADDEGLVALAKARNDAAGLAEAYYRQGYYYSALGDERKALDIYHVALATSSAANDRRLEAIVLSLMAVSQFRLGLPAGAAASAEKALNLALEGQDDETLSRVLANVSVHVSGTGDLARAVQLQQQQVTLNRQMNKRVGEAIGLSNMGYNYGRLGLFAESRKALEEALAISGTIGARQLAQYARLNLGLTYWRIGWHEKAQGILTEAIEGLDAVGDAFGKAAGQSYLGLTLEATGNKESASVHYQEAMDAFHDIGQEGFARGGQAGLIRCCLFSEDLPGTRRHVAELWEYLVTGGARTMEFPAMAFITCADAFGRLSDVALADRAVAAGYDDLMSRTEKISDPDWRRSFLKNLEEHNRLVKMHWLQVGPHGSLPERT
jgi:tetratricopeptide (TPR) repeat protein